MNLTNTCDQPEVGNENHVPRQCSIIYLNLKTPHISLVTTAIYSHVSSSSTQYPYSCFNINLSMHCFTCNVLIKTAVTFTINKPIDKGLLLRKIKLMFHSSSFATKCMLSRRHGGNGQRKSGERDTGYPRLLLRYV